MDTPRSIIVGSDELEHILEPLIRRIIREELLNIVGKTNTVNLDSDTPLYKNLQEIIQRKKKQEIELFSHEEVWDD